ncbi:unnamed protein product [Euphydryas editha]|uniref:Maturase K n=1 Tax=Euphydryas editha TaxID=104508 RepID=A0AAU9UJ65_EUPED|nr:unnamed protein product [Euphydryas editha]
MESKKNKVVRVSSGLLSPSLEVGIIVPLDIILYLAKFLRFDDYRNFIKCFWPVDNEPDIIRKKMWQLSTHRIMTKFLNGQLLEIEYNFDASRTEENRILFNVNTLRPVFGGVRPRGEELFLSPSKLHNFIRMHVHMNMCNRLKYAACLCHQFKTSSYTSARIVKPQEVACKYVHFHHYCYQHVRSWLDFFLMPTVRLHEKIPSLFTEDMSESFLLFLSNTVQIEQR